MSGPVKHHRLVGSLLLTASLAAVFGCSGHWIGNEVTVVQAVHGRDAEEIPSAWARNCEDLGKVEIRVQPGSEVDTSFSWAAHPKYSVYLETLKRKVARAGGNAVMAYPPARAGLGSQGILEGRAYRCPDEVRVE